METDVMVMLVVTLDDLGNTASESVPTTIGWLGVAGKVRKRDATPVPAVAAPEKTVKFPLVSGVTYTGPKPVMLGEPAIAVASIVT